MRSGLLALLTLSTVAAQERRFPIEKLTIEGTRFPQSAVLAITGLQVGASAGEADFTAAAQKLRDTGLFQDVGFQFAPGPARGYVVSFVITDYAEWLAASIQVPGVSEDQIWKCVQTRFPIVVPKGVPANERAEMFYGHAIQECVAEAGKNEEIIARTFSALASGREDVVFRPKTLPVITAVRFEGTKAVDAGALMKALTPVAVGSEYIERSFREMLQRNVVPIYEEMGYLRVSFPKIAVEMQDPHSVAVTATVSEGLAYNIGTITVEGEGVDGPALLRLAAFHRGQLANWSDVLKKIQDMEQPLRRKGYLAPQFVPERMFHDEAHIVDLKIVVNNGAQYYFGQVTFKGLPPQLEGLAKASWAHRSGDVMDEGYLTEFLKKLRERPEFSNVKGFEVAMEAGAAQNIMDITIKVK